MSRAVLERLRHELRLVAVAVQFLTRLPVPSFPNWNDRWLNDCVRHFPLVGLLVGSLGGAVLWAAGQLWTPGVAALLAVAATALATGAFHEDGLADTFDALGGSVSRERALVIMKDSRIGSYGALALVLVTGLRVAALASLAQASLPGAALACALGHALARGVPLILMTSLAYGGDAEHAKAKPLATQVDRSQRTVAAGWALVAATITALAWPALAGGAAGAGVGVVLAAAAACGAVAMAMRRWLARRLGGYTGDALGASEQLAEAAAWLAMAAWVGA